MIDRTKIVYARLYYGEFPPALFAFCHLEEWTNFEIFKLSNGMIKVAVPDFFLHPDDGVPMPLRYGNRSMIEVGEIAEKVSGRSLLRYCHRSDDIDWFIRQNIHPSMWEEAARRLGNYDEWALLPDGNASGFLEKRKAVILLRGLPRACRQCGRRWRFWPHKETVERLCEGSFRDRRGRLLDSYFDLYLSKSCHRPASGPGSRKPVPWEDILREWYGRKYEFCSLGCVKTFKRQIERKIRERRTEWKRYEEGRKILRRIRMILANREVCRSQTGASRRATSSQV